ncbi:hypothetical protein SAMN05421684_6903 [Asanoa ishikariensis]|uniref:Uncharacterized protein n=1 Tax=Asanoa ishikariensis TaxID=137265 RepID=A0A1H3UD52_9ACTN|nr:hypothetical protein [Asanoa ishikariensis]SDZ59579.1 hypothetical protein SAMN05421684_6903 [Asanoa ishikariensis]
MHVQAAVLPIGGRRRVSELLGADVIALDGSWRRPAAALSDHRLRLLLCGTCDAAHIGGLAPPVEDGDPVVTFGATTWQAPRARLPIRSGFLSRR